MKRKDFIKIVALSAVGIASGIVLKPTFKSHGYFTVHGGSPSTRPNNVGVHFIIPTDQRMEDFLNLLIKELDMDLGDDILHCASKDRDCNWFGSGADSIIGRNNICFCPWCFGSDFNLTKNAHLI